LINVESVHQWDDGVEYRFTGEQIIVVILAIYKIGSRQHANNHSGFVEHDSLC
jgi:hypothetical protein